MMPGNKRSPLKRPVVPSRPKAGGPLGQEGQFWKAGQSRPGRIAVPGTVSGPSDRRTVLGLKDESGLWTLDDIRLDDQRLIQSTLSFFFLNQTNDVPVGV